MGTKSERLAVLPDAEQYALYGLPDFDDGQRSEYLSLSPQEVLLASSRSSLHARVYCALQIGYFKAKHAFFHFTWDDVREDCSFILTRYFNEQDFEAQAITKHECYAQCTMIAELFGYRLWVADFLPLGHARPRRVPANRRYSERRVHGRAGSRHQHVFSQRHAAASARGSGAPCSRAGARPHISGACRGI